MALLVRLLANCESVEVAIAVSRRVASILARFGGEEASPPKQYWKMPELYELTYELCPATSAAFEEILSYSRGGWHHLPGESERSSVWNRTGDFVFLVPEVCWAEVQLYEPVA